MKLELSYGYDYKCHKCGRQQDFLYYCEQCYRTFCNECVITEKTECTFCNDCSHLSVGNQCEKCGKVNNLTARKFVRKCPICSSTKFKDLSRKINGLPSEYVKAINLISKGYEIIKEFAANYSEVTNQAKYLRRERFGLYPDIENYLIRIQDHFYETSNRASELLERVYRQIHQDTCSLTLNQQVTVSKLPQIDRSLQMIRSHATSYSSLLDDFLREPRAELTEVKKVVEELKQYSNIFNNQAHKFQPEFLEFKVAAFSGVKFSFPDEKLKRVSILFITNKHLYFLPCFKFIFHFYGKVRVMPAVRIMDVGIKSNKLLGPKIIIKLTNEQKIKIKAPAKISEKIDFLLKVIVNDNEGYLINDAYLLEDLRANLNFTPLREQIERRIKDLKELPFVYRPQQRRPHRISEVIGNSEEVKQLRRELKAAKDTLRQLIKAFEDRSITPEVYFSRREKTTQRILALEDTLKETLRGQIASDYGYFRGAHDEQQYQR